MDDKSTAIQLVVSEYNVATPVLSIPEDAPKWVQHVFPALLHTIHNGFNSVMEKVICGFNDSLGYMQNQIDDLTKTLKEHADMIETLKVSLQQKQYYVDEQNTNITKLKNTVDMNESYSRRNNLILVESH